MVGWIVVGFVVGGCSHRSPPAPAVAPGHPAAIEVESPALVGILIANVPDSLVRPDSYCLEDGQHYLGAPARIGDRNVLSEAPLDGLIGQLVVATGDPIESWLTALTPSGPCPPDLGAHPAELPQMRSDWVSPEGGFRTTADRLAAIAAFRADRVEALDFIAVDHGTDQVTVVLTNPWSEPLDGLVARAHYEGGPGKPMPRYEPIAIDLGPGARQSIVLDLEVVAGPAGRDRGTPRGVYRLDSLDLQGQIGEVTFDVRFAVR